jgi:hypothetical protein
MPKHSVDAELLGETDDADIDLNDVSLSYIDLNYRVRVERAVARGRDGTVLPDAALLRARWPRG